MSPGRRDEALETGNQGQTRALLILDVNPIRNRCYSSATGSDYGGLKLILEVG